VNRAKELKRQVGWFWILMPMTCRYFSFLCDRAGNPAAFRKFANGNSTTRPCRTDAHRRRANIQSLKNELLPKPISSTKNKTGQD
jgi:hypothetical protein